VIRHSETYASVEVTMKKRFIVVLAFHTRDGLVVLVWIIRPPLPRAVAYSSKTSHI
jgi:hypothetical protein